MSSVRDRASVKMISSLLVLTEPDQGRVASPCTTAAEHSVERLAQQEELTVERYLAYEAATDEKPRISSSLLFRFSFSLLMLMLLAVRMPAGEVHNDASDSNQAKSKTC